MFIMLKFIKDTSESSMRCMALIPNFLYIYFMNAVSRFEYTVNMMCREKILLMQNQILSMQKNIFDYLKFKHEKAFRFGF